MNIDETYLSSKKVAVTFKIQGQDRLYFVKRRNAQTLLWLVHKGEEGVTAAEMSSWALRLSAYVFILRRHYGLSILTLREPHDGGHHARYVLKTPVELVSICLGGKDVK